MNATPDFNRLRRSLVERQYAAFLDDYEATYEATPESDQGVLRALAGEGLVQYLSDEPAPEPETTSRFFRLHALAQVDLPDSFSMQLTERWKIFNKRRSTDASLSNEGASLVNRSPSKTDTSKTIIRTKRVIQVVDYQWGTFSVSDALGLRQSVFRSKQERSFLRALSLRFPGLSALPNYPLDQIADFSKLKAVLDDDAIRFGRRCRLDALLVIPDEGDPVAAFELDSGHHDSPEARKRDQLKDRLLQVVGIPLFRLRASESETMDTDEWYTLLTEEVLDRISCGERVRSRRFHSTLVPVGN